MNKVAIITLHRVYNYGSVLQAYATQRIFENAGYSVQIIDYVTAQRTFFKILFKFPKKYSSNVFKIIPYIFVKTISIVLKELTFGAFIRRNLKLTRKYTRYEDLIKNPPIADIYVTGSDQTWNSNYNEGIDRGFFLDFLPDNSRRISFSSSFGKDILSDNEKDETLALLKKYERISVREDTGVQIIKDLGLQDPIQILDPTLIIDKHDWIKITKPRLYKKPYLLLMLLYNEDNNATVYAKKIAKDKNLKLVKISWEIINTEVDKLFTHRSPSDFLSLFYHADFIVTNSFHGLAFSLNFEKQFIVVPRNEYNSRLKSLLRLLSIEERMVSSSEEVKKISNQIINYKLVNSNLQLERIKANNFIKNL